jgi:ribosomal protein S18 acetylase RimI-like enzyme
VTTAASLANAPVLIRPATAADAPAIARVHVAAWQTTYRGLLPADFLAGLSVAERTARWARRLSQESQPGGVFVAETADGQIVGFVAGGAPQDDHPLRQVYRGELHAIYLLADYQRQGIGRRLVRALAAAFQTAGLDSFFAWVLAENHPARRFYAALGGQVVGERPITIAGLTLPEVAYGWIDLGPLLALPP